MSTTFEQTEQLWPVFTIIAPEASTRIAPGAAATMARSRGHRATRYERFTTRVVVASSFLMLLFTALLHVLNYDLETQTSSTSGTHSAFSNTTETGGAEQQEQ